MSSLTSFINKYLFNLLLALASMIIAASPACTSTQQTGPTIYSSASSLSYATEYPARLEALNKKIDQVSSKAKGDWTQFDRFAGELSDPRWDEVKTVYEKADLAGRSEALVEWMRKSDNVTEFIDTNDIELSQRIGSQVNAQIKKGEKQPTDGEKEFDSRPVVRWALKSATTKVIDDRYRQLNEAHRFIAAYGDFLGKKNVKALEAQVDKITEASFIVNVVFLELRQQMQTKVAEADEVKHTLDSEIEKLQVITDAPESSKKDKTAAKEKIAELLKTKAPIDADAQKVKQNLDGFDKRYEQFQKEYQDAYLKLLDVVDQKAAEMAKVGS